MFKHSWVEEVKVHIRILYAVGIFAQANEPFFMSKSAPGLSWYEIPQHQKLLVISIFLSHGTTLENVWFNSKS